MTQIPPATRLILAERSQGMCEACGQSRADQAHHRQPRGAGGTSLTGPHSPANLLHLDRICHARIEDHLDPLTGRPADTYELGLHVRRGSNPAAVPVRLAHGVYGPAWWWLVTQGGMAWHAPWAPPRRPDQLPTRPRRP